MPDSATLTFSTLELAELLHEFDVNVDGRFRLPADRSANEARLCAFFKVLRAHAKIVGAMPSHVEFDSRDLAILGDHLLARDAKPIAKPAPAKKSGARKRGRPRKRPLQSTIDDAIDESFTASRGLAEDLDLDPAELADR